MRHKKLKQRFGIFFAVVLMLTCGMLVYVNDYYQADETALEILNNKGDENLMVEIEMPDEGTLAFVPKNPKAAFIFYPGGKVEYSAYAPLMQSFAEQGILCILPEMPGNLAVLDMYAAKRYRNLYPDIDKWYIGGHSLGGSMAASCVSEYIDEYEGLVLLASYSTADLSETDLQVISIYGSEDKVLNTEKYQKYKSNLTSETHELMIDGGCHAFFGNYGAQDRDGTPRITREEQIEQAVAYCVDKMLLESE